MPCSGTSNSNPNNIEICGAGSRLSLYAMNNYITPSIPQTVAGYIYAGCYTEATTGRALTGGTKIDYSGMTVDVCAGFCIGRGAGLWGIEFGGECRCGNTLAAESVIAPKGDSECSTTCPGNYTQLACGDGKRFNLYKLPHVTTRHARRLSRRY